MSTDAPIQPPRKKRSVMWWLGGFFVVLLLVFFFQLFGPSPRIIVSPQTTRIMGPLRPDGLPDYEKYLLQQCRDGVTRENNAASLLWPALWPGELDPPQYAAVAAELGLDAIPLKADAVVPVNRRINDWLHSHSPATEDSGATITDVDQQADAIFEQVTSRPWTGEQFPWLAKWASENRKPLDKMVEASHRTRCYFPSPTALNNQNDTLIAMLLPGAQGVRECGRSLVARAMWHVGEHRPAKAWQDLLAIHRIGRLTTQGPTLVDQLVGMAIDGIACRGTAAMLHEGQLSEKQARQVLHDLEALENFSRMADCMDVEERLSFVDAVTQLSHGGIDRKELGLPENDNMIRYLHHFRVDWNIVLRKGNEWYDRYVEAARLPTFAARQQRLGQLDRDIEQLANRFGVGTLVACALNPKSRADAVASIMLSMFLPAIDMAMFSQDRANATLDLNRLAAALAVYRAAHGSYPNKLGDLVTGVIAKLPVDLYNAKPFIYRRIDDGYLLYSAGPNGQDDGGSNEQWNTYEGILLDDLNEGEAEKAREKIPAGADDFSIRVPRPASKLSNMPLLKKTP